MIGYEIGNKEKESRMTQIFGCVTYMSGDAIKLNKIELIIQGFGDS